ncbi:MAG: dimethyl sulfoxide reductase anchor subunit family protein [Ferrovibrionaceae bacterium]
MHPAYSVILFTTASGTGYGLLAFAALFSLLGRLPGDAWFLGGLVALALALIAGGLLSSTFHLGRPERAWRAFSQWRTSWLSREGVLACLSFPVALGFAAGRVFGLGGTAGLAVATIAISIATVATTAMIYASLRPIRHWHHPLVPLGYVVFAGQAGAAWLQMWQALWGRADPLVTAAAVLLPAVGLIVKLAYWRAVDTGRAASTAETATGLGRFGRVRPLDPPHTSANYLLNEMGYRVARRHAAKLRGYALALAFVVPSMLSAVALVGSPGLAATVAVVAAAAMSLGLVVERWLFFAEARHSVTLYYDAQPV